MVTVMFQKVSPNRKTSERDDMKILSDWWWFTLEFQTLIIDPFMYIVESGIEKKNYVDRTNQIWSNHLLLLFEESNDKKNFFCCPMTRVYIFFDTDSIWYHYDRWVKLKEVGMPFKILTWKTNKIKKNIFLSGHVKRQMTFYMIGVSKWPMAEWLACLPTVF